MSNNNNASKRICTYTFANGTKIHAAVDDLDKDHNPVGYQALMDSAKTISWRGNEEHGRGGLVSFEVGERIWVAQESGLDLGSMEITFRFDHKGTKAVLEAVTTRRALSDRREGVTYSDWTSEAHDALLAIIKEWTQYGQMEMLPVAVDLFRKRHGTGGAGVVPDPPFIINEILKEWVKS